MKPSAGVCNFALLLEMELTEKTGVVICAGRNWSAWHELPQDLCFPNLAFFKINTEHYVYFPEKTKPNKTKTDKTTPK